MKVSLREIALVIIPLLAASCATGKNISPLMNQGIEYRKIMERQKAKAEESAIQKVAPLTAEGHEEVGDQHLRVGNIDAAFKSYYESLKLKPVSRVRYKVGRLFLEKDMTEDARKDFEEMLKLDPQSALAHEGLGRCSFARQQWAEAEREFLEAIRLNPDQWPAHNFLGIMYDRQRKFERAIEQYRRAIALQPNIASLYNNLGVSFFMKGDYEHSAAALTEGLRLDAVNKKLLNNFSLVLCKLGRYQEALETFKKAGTEATAYYNIACIYFMENKYQEAVLSFKKAIELKPEFYLSAYENMKKAQAAIPIINFKKN